MGGPSNTGEGKGECASCGSPAETKCTGCRNVFYCGRECQKKGWPNHKDVCRPFTVSKNQKSGKHLVASRDLEVDDLIVTEAPLVLGPKQDTDPVCLGCYKRISGNYRCSHCTWPMCGPKCEVLPEHQPECEVTRAAGLNIPLEDLDSPNHLYEVITVLRCLVLAGKDSKRWKSAAERLNNRYMKTAGTPQYYYNEEHVVQVLKHKFKLEDHPEIDASEASIQNALGLLQFNNVPTKTAYAEVQAIYPMASLASHSCVPNTKPVFKDGKLTMRASDPIKRGEPITSIYADILWGTRARRDYLWQTRLFSCTCKRCRDPTELNTYFSALICRRCSKVMLPIDPMSEYAPWSCEGCSSEMSIEEALRTTLALGAAVEIALTNPTIEGLESIQNEWLTRAHPNHYHLHAIKHSLLQLYGRSKEKADEKEKDAAHWIEITKKEKACKEFLTVCSRLDPSTSHTIPFVGLTFYEYHKTILQNSQRLFSQAKLSTQQLKKRMLLSKALLKKAMEIFKYEAEDTPEGQLYITCEEEVIHIGKWMLAVGLI